jgi:hypothetical protein
LFQRYASIVPASIVSGKRLERQRETGIWEDVVFYVKKGKCFPFLIKRKTLSCDESYFFFLPELTFLWLTFCMVTKHGKMRKMVFRNLFSWKQIRH